MTQVTRRGFLIKTTAGAATIGALVAAPGLADAQITPAASEREIAEAERSGLMVAHIRNVARGEIALMVGTREIIIHDRKLTARLLRAAR